MHTFSNVHLYYYFPVCTLLCFITSLHPHGVHSVTCAFHYSSTPVKGKPSYLSMDSLPLPFESGKTKQAQQSSLNQLCVTGPADFHAGWDGWGQKSGVNNSTQINKNLDGTSPKEISPREKRGEIDQTGMDGWLSCTDIIQQLPMKGQAYFREGGRIARSATASRAHRPGTVTKVQCHGGI